MLLFELDCCRRDSCIQLFGNISIHSLARRLTRIWWNGCWSYIISIHSLARRLTTGCVAYVLVGVISIHSLARRLTATWLLYDIFSIFQFTASQGGWHVSGIHSSNVICISIHSLARRLTIPLFVELNPRVYFNSQPRKEADWYSRKSFTMDTYFNSQPRKEADDQRC